MAHVTTVRIVRRGKPSLDSLGFHHRLFITSSRARITRDAVRGASVIRSWSGCQDRHGTRHAGDLRTVGRTKNHGGTLLQIGGPDWGSCQGPRGAAQKSLTARRDTDSEARRTEEGKRRLSCICRTADCPRDISQAVTPGLSGDTLLSSGQTGGLEG